MKTITKRQRVESKKMLITRSAMTYTEDMLPSRNWHLKDGKLIYRLQQEVIFQ